MGIFTKFVLVALNLGVFALGITVVTMSSIAIASNDTYGELLGDGIVSLPVAALVFGVILFFVGFFGCFGALNQNGVLLNLYAIMMLLFVIGELIIAILIFTKNDAFFEKMVERPLTESMNRYGMPGYYPTTKAWDNMQQDMECCGVETYKDWEQTPIGVEFDAVPDSCCKQFEEECGHDFAEEDIWPTGCYDSVVGKLDSVETAIVLLILIVIQILCIIWACGIKNKISSKYAEEYYDER